MGKPFKGNVSVVEDDTRTRLKELTLVELNLEEAPSEELYGIDVMVRAAHWTYKLHLYRAT